MIFFSQVNYRELLGLVIFWMLFGLATVSLQRQMETVELHITAKGSLDSVLQVYWRGKSGHYSESDSLSWNVRTHSRKMRFRIPLKDNIDFIRLDPLKHAGMLEVEDAVIRQLRREPVDLIPLFRGGDVSVLQQGGLEQKGESVVLISTGTDPVFEIAQDPPIIPSPKLGWLTGCLFLSILSYVALNQDLLKGRKNSGTLLVVREDGELLRLPGELADLSGQVYRYNGTNDKVFTKYVFHLQDASIMRISSLQRQLRGMNPGAAFSFQFNRSGEV